MTSSYNKNNRIPESSYIYNSEGPVALSLGLIILSELVLSRIHHRNALTEKAREDAVQGLGTEMSELATSQPLIST